MLYKNTAHKTSKTTKIHLQSGQVYVVKNTSMYKYFTVHYISIMSTIPPIYKDLKPINRISVFSFYR